MKKLINYFYFIIVFIILICVPILIFMRSSYFVNFSIAGLLTIITCDFLKSRFIKNVKPVNWKVPVIYIAIIILDLGLVYLEHNKDNLPELVSHFSSKMILASIKADDYNSSQLTTEQLWNYFRQRPQMPIYKLLNSSINLISKDKQNKTADSLRDSYFQFYRYPAVKLSNHLSWKEDPFNDPSWNNRLHKMDYINLLVNEYIRKKDLRYLKQCESLIIDWINTNSNYFFAPPSVYSWGDYATAFRLMNWLYFWETWSKSPLFTTDKMKLILSSIIAHGMRLSNPRFYSIHNNHGISQDFSLILLTCIFPEIKEAKEWREIGFKRLQDEIRHAISSNGIQLEHSAHYHFYGLGQIEQLNNLMKIWDIKDKYSLELESLVEKMKCFIKFTIQPDGRIVSTGDTGIEDSQRFADILAEFGYEDKDINNLLVNKDYSSLHDTAIAFPREGYAVIRDLIDHEHSYVNSFYLFFTAAAHIGRVHKHSDDLSFVLSDDGQNLLIDPGNYSYRKDEFRNYISGTSAHNTITVDDHSFKGFNTTFESFICNPSYISISASHFNYPELKHRRWLIYIKSGLIFVIDELKPYFTQNSNNKKPAIHKFEQFFHTSNEIIIKANITRKEVQFRNQNSEEPEMQILQLGDDSTKINVYSGSKNPIQGWSTKYHGTLEPAPVVGFEKHGRNTIFITVLELKRFLIENKEKHKPSFHYKRDKDIININWIEKVVQKNILVDLANKKVNYLQGKL